MVAAFLRAEIDADRWGRTIIIPGLAAYGWPQSLIREPDTTDADQNARRAHLLGDCRGWRRGTYLFRTFPPDVTWHHAELSQADIGAALGANYETWRDLTNGSRRFADAAGNVRAERLPEVADAPNDAERARRITDVAGASERARRIAARYRAGEVLERPVLVARSPDDQLIGVEGHTRLIAWLLSRSPGPLPVIVGFSERIGEWHWI
jgi:hypothetical protein